MQLNIILPPQLLLNHKIANTDKNQTGGNENEERCWVCDKAGKQANSEHQYAAADQLLFKRSNDSWFMYLHDVNPLIA
jgi:hypothetical protein